MCPGWADGVAPDPQLALGKTFPEDFPGGPGRAPAPRGLRGLPRPPSCSARQQARVGSWNCRWPPALPTVLIMQVTEAIAGRFLVLPPPPKKAVTEESSPAGTLLAVKDLALHRPQTFPLLAFQNSVPAWGKGERDGIFPASPLSQPILSPQGNFAPSPQISQYWGSNNGSPPPPPRICCGRLIIAVVSTSIQC